MTSIRTTINYKVDYSESPSFYFPVFLDCTSNELITDNTVTIKQKSNYNS